MKDEGINMRGCFLILSNFRRVEEVHSLDNPCCHNSLKPTHQRSSQISATKSMLRSTCKEGINSQKTATQHVKGGPLETQESQHKALLQVHSSFSGLCCFKLACDDAVTALGCMCSCLVFTLCLDVCFLLGSLELLEWNPTRERQSSLTIHSIYVHFRKIVAEGPNKRK